MTFIDSLIDQARGTGQRIVLPEGEDARIVEGAIKAERENIATPILLGNRERVEAQLTSKGGSIDRIRIIDPAESSDTPAYAEAWHAMREKKGMDAPTALRQMRESVLVHAAMMVHRGDADATIGGAVHTTGDTVRAALQIIGRAPGVSTVSSFFLMLLEQAHHGEPRALLFGDCALIIQPSSEELAQIALSSAASFSALTGGQARVAMLSFSTAGSARHERVDVVSQAVSRARELGPDLLIDGELQFDAAFVPAVAAQKAPESPLAGEANVFIFPSLEAGNIGYKIAQRIGGANAIGPVLQGLARPANDLSRGCSAEDVYRLIALTALQSRQ